MNNLKALIQLCHRVSEIDIAISGIQSNVSYYTEAIKLWQKHIATCNMHLSQTNASGIIYYWRGELERGQTKLKESEDKWESFNKLLVESMTDLLLALDEIKRNTNE